MDLLICLNGLEYRSISGDLKQQITGIAFDSRKVDQGKLFVAIKGFSTDGHRYIEQAIKQGAAAIVYENDIDAGLLKNNDVSFVRVDDARKALAGISANFFDQPTSKLNLVGITGTNGKTSISYFLKALLEHAGYKTGIMGTIGTLIGDKKIETPNTTPESLTVQTICDEMVNAAVDYAVMEVSSHALDLNRVAYCQFKSGIYTNLTPDHLELHKDMAHYFEAKAKLFNMTSKANIINRDDAYGQLLIERLKAHSAVSVITYGLTDEADVYATDIRYAIDHTLYMANTPSGTFSIRVNIPGEIYVYNSLAVVAWAYAEGFTPEMISAGIEALAGVKGRFETVYDRYDKKVVIDFAHTEDGLEKALSTLRPFVKNRLLLVFGVYAAPGALGEDKRRAMGAVAAIKSDFCFVTSDNPKEQDPVAIIDEVVASVVKNGGRYEAIVDRKQAIERALEFMQPGDIMLISGKGHETAQVIGKVEIPFNETEIVQNKMRKLEAQSGI